MPPGFANVHPTLLYKLVTLFPVLDEMFAAVFCITSSFLKII